MHDIKQLQNTINYQFKDLTLLTQSVTHSSSYFDGRSNRTKNTSNKNYERLEFLGDRVLGLVISEYLLDVFPNEDEGDLNLRYAQLVRKEACTTVAQNLKFENYIILGDNEIKSGLNKNATILGDVCEAIIAALFLDGGMEVAKPFILQNWKEQLQANLPHKQDAKTALQEWAQKLKLPLPLYRVSQTTGPAHAPSFTIEVSVGEYSKTSSSGTSKRIAEQKAATEFLIRENIWSN